jgi:hypothetical protein
MSTDPVDLNAPLRELVEIKTHLYAIGKTLVSVCDLLNTQIDLMRGIDPWKATTTSTTTPKATKTAKPAAKTK